MPESLFGSQPVRPSLTSLNPHARPFTSANHPIASLPPDELESLVVTILRGQVRYGRGDGRA